MRLRVRRSGLRFRRKLRSIRPNSGPLASQLPKDLVATKTGRGILRNSTAMEASVRRAEGWMPPRAPDRERIARRRSQPLSAAGLMSGATMLIRSTGLPVHQTSGASPRAEYISSQHSAWPVGWKHLLDATPSVFYGLVMFPWSLTACGTMVFWPPSLFSTTTTVAVLLPSLVFTSTR